MTQPARHLVYGPPIARRGGAASDLKLLRSEVTIGGTMFLVAFFLVLFSDFALPMTPGAYQPLDPNVQSVLGARLSVQATTAVTPPSLQPRLPAIAQDAAPRPLTVKRHEAPASRPFVPLARSPQHDAEAPNAVDPA